MYLAAWKQNLSTDQLIIFQQEYYNRRKSLKIAVLLWIFLGFYGGHRFYTGSIKKGILVLVSSIVLYAAPLLFIYFTLDSYYATQSELDDAILGKMGFLLVSFFLIFVIWVVEGFRLKKSITRANEAIEQKLMQEMTTVFGTPVPAPNPMPNQYHAPNHNHNPNQHPNHFQ